MGPNFLGKTSERPAAFFSKCSVLWSNVAVGQFQERCWPGTTCSKLPSVLQCLVGMHCISSFRRQHRQRMRQNAAKTKMMAFCANRVGRSVFFSLVIRRNVPETPWNVQLCYTSFFFFLLGGGVCWQFSPHSSGDSATLFCRNQSCFGVDWDKPEQKQIVLCLLQKGCRLLTA